MNDERRRHLKLAHQVAMAGLRVAEEARARAVHKEAKLGIDWDDCEDTPHLFHCPFHGTVPAVIHRDRRGNEYLGCSATYRPWGCPSGYQEPCEMHEHDPIRVSRSAE